MSEPPTSFKKCLKCGTKNEFVLRFGGYRCTSCKEFALYLNCPACSNQFFLFGPFAGKGPTYFQCPNCKKELQIHRASVSQKKETIRATTSARAARIRDLSRAAQRATATAKRTAREETARQNQERTRSNSKNREAEAELVRKKTKQAEQKSLVVAQRLGEMRTLLIAALGKPPSSSNSFAPLPKPTGASFKPRTKKPVPAPVGTPPAPPSTTKPRLEHFFPSHIPGTLYSREEQFDSALPAFDEKVDPVACLTSLKAAVSRSPEELVAVKPIVAFDMVDPRFVKEANVLTGLDTRPNLMELTPSEFESLVTNLFENMGLETRLTQASRDGGVDCVAWDTRPIFGGKVIIQAKRYKNTVGPSAVRDLFGAMHNEGATKGILITTSGYGPTSYEFADNKPLELLDGANLLYLLKEHAGVDAIIEVPDEWVDPIADNGSDL